MKLKITFYLFLTSLLVFSCSYSSSWLGKSFVHPITYIHNFTLITDDQKIDIINKDYTKYGNIKESNEIIAKFKNNDAIKVEVSGASPQLGYTWVESNLQIVRDQIYVKLYKEHIVGQCYPDVIDPFSFTFDIGKLNYVTYYLFICEKKLGKIEVE